MARLKVKYTEEVAPALFKKFGYKSTMQIPKIDKVVVNVGCGEAKENAKVLEAVVRDLTTITGQKAIITIAKTGMSSEPGSLLKILNVLAKHEVNVEYLPSGIDNVSLVVSSDKVSRSLYEMLGELQKEVQPNKITVTEHIAIVAAVGRKMAYRPGVSGKIFAKLGENGVNIRMITQGPEELNIIVGVEEKDFEQAIRVLYNSFVKENVV